MGAGNFAILWIYEVEVRKLCFGGNFGFLMRVLNVVRDNGSENGVFNEYISN